MKILTTLLSFLFFSWAYAQENLTAAGADAGGAGGTASFSIGLVAYSSGGVQILVSQGVQQAHGLSFPAIFSSKLQFSIYPNPATTVVSVEVKSPDYAGLDYQLCSVDGKILSSKKATSHRTGFVVSQFAAGTYFLRVLQNRQPVHSFKFIKN